MNHEYSRLQVVQAFRVHDIQPSPTKVRVNLDDPDLGPVFVDREKAQKLGIEPGGYVVIGDFPGFEYMPAREFESRFRRLPN